MDDLAAYGLYFAVLLAAGWLLAAYMTRVYAGEAPPLARVLGPLERGIYRLMGTDPGRGQGWRGYALAVLIFNAAGFVLLYAILRLQGWLPLNPDAIRALSPDLAFNTAISFVTNTNWQAYSGEAQLSYFSQMVGLTMQNFVSAGTGMAVAVAVIRGFAGPKGTTLGNFWVDLTRSVLYILLPLSLVFAVFLAVQGVPQTFLGVVVHATTLDGAPGSAPVRPRERSRAPHLRDAALRCSWPRAGPRPRAAWGQRRRHCAGSSPMHRRRWRCAMPRAGCRRGPAQNRGRH